MGRQPQGHPKQEILATDSLKFEPRDANRSFCDAKPMVSSPISSSTSAVPQSSSILPQNSSSSITPMSTVVAPKRKKPRQVKYDDENSSIFTVRSCPISSTTKAETDKPTKIETSSSSNLEKNLGSTAENGGLLYDLANPEAVPASSEAQRELTVKQESNYTSDSKLLTEESEDKDVRVSKEEPSQTPRKESPVLRLDDNREDAMANKANSTISETEGHKEKLQIDLMAPPPPPLRASPERDSETEFVAVDPKSMVTNADTEIKMENEKAVKVGKDEAVNVENERAKTVAAEETESQKPVVGHERIIDLQLDLEKTDRDSGTASVSGNNKLHHHVQKHHHQQSQHASTERSAQTSSLPLPMPVPGWPGGLPPMGYMAPLQGVLSVDGSTVSPAAMQPPQLLFAQPRPKRCATHYYIARNIQYHQQLARMNPYWPAAAGSASLYGAKPGNLNLAPSAELHGNIPGRGVNSTQDKGQGISVYPGHTGKDKGSQAAANIVDAAQRKQILIQQAMPPGAPSNILHTPAFIFPLTQQQPAAAAASVRSGPVKSPVAGSVASSSASSSAPVSAPATAAAPAMSFNYPSMPGNETQYLAILQNNAYPFPLPAHVGAPPAYRGTHAQAMPFFNGSFYSSQMLHPQIHHHQQQQQQQPPAQSQQSLQQTHQNAMLSSTSQKHLQNQQQRAHANGVNGGSGTLQGFPAPKNQSSQLQQQRQHVPHQARQLESEMGGEDSPSTADSRFTRANIADSRLYGQNFAVPMHPPNFALMTPAAMGSAGVTSGGSTEKKQQQQPQQPGSKAGVEPLPSQAFAMSFASINGATSTPALGITSIAQSQAFQQGLGWQPSSGRGDSPSPEMSRQGYQIMPAAAQAAQQKKNFRASEEGKTGGGDSSNVEEERKAMPGKVPVPVGQSIAFSRQDLTDTSVNTVKGNNVVDSSARALNLGSASGRSSGLVMPAAISTVNAPGSQQQLHRNQQQQMIQHQKQNQFTVAAAATAARSKTPASNGSVYSDHLPSPSSMAAKFTNALSSFPQNLVQTSNNTPAQSQWKSPIRTTTSQVPSPSVSSSTSSSLKNLTQQQQGRNQQSHTQISFGASAKPSTIAQGQQPSNGNQCASPQVMVGSPTTSSMSKGAGGSPRTTTSSSTANKAGPGSMLSSTQAKDSPSVPMRKSSPVGGRNVPSILGNSHVASTSGNSTRPQLLPQQPPKQAIQPAQFFFPNSYMQALTGTTSASAAGGYYLQRNRREQQQQSQGSSGTSSTGMLSLCPPVTLANTNTSDPAKAVAAATAASHMKGGGLPSQGILHVTQFGAAQSSGNQHQLLPSGFYVPISTPVQVKPAEQKQPAGE
ncbi:hypothetical protein I3843_02G082900 [Carya illinoinensis]|nr:hypothetical protein I3842_02G094800 [Carya illinoinensis]KAG7991565.1 hypothetical protein I3843_02G082900 [Carya illinoinensis]